MPDNYAKTDHALVGPKTIAFALAPLRAVLAQLSESRDLRL